MGQRASSIRYWYRYYASELDLRTPQIWGYFVRASGLVAANQLADALEMNGLRLTSAVREAGHIDCLFEGIEMHTPATLITRIHVLDAVVRCVPFAKLEGFSVCDLLLGPIADLRRSGRRWPVQYRPNKKLQQAINAQLEKEAKRIAPRRGAKT